MTFIQLLSTAGLGGMGTLRKFLKSGDVKVGIEVHKNLFEALMRTKIDYLYSNDLVVIDEALVTDLESLITNVNPVIVDKVQQNVDATKLQIAEGNMGKLMDIYLEMVNLMLNFIHFTRQGNWDGYLEAIYEFLPYCFSRHNYARDLSFYYNHMCSLELENPTAYKYLQEGGFSGSLTGLPHSKIPFDQIIEMTINRSCKDIGGLSQSTNDPGTTERWTRNNHLMVALREHQNQKIRRHSRSTSRELGTAKIKRDEANVRCIQDYLEKWVPDILKPTQFIADISYGLKATEQMTIDSPDIKTRGAKSRDMFLEALSSKEKKEVYHDSIKRQEIKLFTVKEKRKKKESIALDESQSFAEVFSLFDEHKLDIRSILQWPVFSKVWQLSMRI